MEGEGSFLEQKLHIFRNFRITEVSGSCIRMPVIA
jgi:hypothetical protein